MLATHHAFQPSVTLVICPAFDSLGLVAKDVTPASPWVTALHHQQISGGWLGDGWHDGDWPSAERPTFGTGAAKVEVTIISLPALRWPRSCAATCPSLPLCSRPVQPLEALRPAGPLITGYLAYAHARMPQSSPESGQE